MGRVNFFSLLTFAGVALLLVASAVLPFNDFWGEVYEREPADAIASGLGDFNLDNEVNVFDIGIFSKCWNSSAVLGVVISSCDFNADQRIDVRDLGLVAGLFGSVYPLPSTVQIAQSPLLDVEAPLGVPSSNGIVKVAVDTADNTYQYFVTYSADDLTGIETAAHIHGPAASGVSGPVLEPLRDGSPKIGIWVYPENLEADILNGLTYINLHTDDLPGGALRAQVTFNGAAVTNVPPPSGIPSPTQISSAPPTSIPTIPPNGGGGSIPVSQTSVPADLSQFSSNPWGVYPNCKAPAIGVEDHSWWWEQGHSGSTEQFPRHLHIATCYPNARDTTGDLLSVSEDVSVILRVMSFNNPSEINHVGGGFQDNSNSLCHSGRGANCIQLPENLKCQNSPDELRECTWYFPLTWPISSAPHAGINEQRMKPDSKHPDLGNTRQFATLNFQVYIKDGRTESNYRNDFNPVIRSWYTDFKYTNVSIKNYVHLMEGDLTKSMPVLSGVVPLDIRHSKGQGTNTSKLFLDPGFHSNPQFHLEATTDGQVDPLTGTKLLYKKPGLWEGTFMWDTCQETNGVHGLYAQTESHREGQGMNAGAFNALVDIQNPPGSCP